MPATAKFNNHHKTTKVTVQNASRPEIINLLELADNESHTAVINLVKGLQRKIALRSEEMNNLRGEIHGIKNKWKF